MPLSDWEINEEDIEICKRSDGSLWHLGAGSYGQCVSLHTWHTSSTMLPLWSGTRLGAISGSQPVNPSALAPGE